MAKAEAKRGELLAERPTFLGERAFTRLLLLAGVRAYARNCLGSRLLAQVIVYARDCLHFYLLAHVTVCAFICLRT